MEITRQSEVKYLSVTIEEQLSWKKQVDTVRKKSLAGLGMRRRTSACLPSAAATRCLLYNTLVLPHLDYCSAVYHCRKAILACTKLWNVYYLEEATSNQKWAPPKGTRLDNSNNNKGITYQVHRCPPAYLCKKFETNVNSNNMRTRGRNKLFYQQTHVHEWQGHPVWWY